MSTNDGDGSAEQGPEFLDMPPGSHYSVRLPMAMAYAATQTAPQSRKDDAGSPYVVHLMAVCRGVLLYGWGDDRFAGQIEDLAIAGLLHDLAEDHGGEPRLAEIADMFGPRVAQVVRHATDSLAQDPTQKAPWRQRKEDHIARIRALSAETADGTIVDAGTCLVIGCDKLDNLTSTADGVAKDGEGYLARFKGGADGTRWYYRSMYEALRPALPPALATDLSAQLARLGA